MFRRMRNRLTILFRGHRFRRDMDEEMSFHIECLIEDLMRQGMDPREARRQARIRFGSAERVQSRSREERGMAFFDETGRNLRFAFRGLARSPLLSTTFILTLALCIGLGTAVFSVVDAVLWKPLPYPTPEKLAHAILFDPAFGKSPGNTAADGRTWERIRDEGDVLQRAVYSGWVRGVNLTTDGAAAFVQQQRVGAGYFRTLGIQPQIGREFEVAEDLPGGPPLVILSHDLWTGTFDGDPEIVGSTIRLKGEAHTVVGIMPEGFLSQANADVWTPLQPSTQGEGSGTNYAILVRIPEGMSFAEADARVSSIQPPEDSRPGAPERQLGLVALDEALTAGVRLPMLILLGAIGLMLVVGCANLAGLQIARSLGRKVELATRRALGSGTRALVRQMVTENLVLGILGGLAGLGVAYLGVQGLEGMVRTYFGTWQEIGLDGRALGAAAALTVLATLLFALAPILQISRTDVGRILVSGSRVMGGHGHLLRKALLVGEVAMVTALLFAAGLLARSYGHLDGLDPGFDPEGVLTMQLSLDDARYADSDNVLELFQGSLEEIRRINGVSGAAVALTLPYERPLNLTFRLPGDGPDTNPRLTNAVYVTPGFFETLGIPLLQGRTLVDADREGAPLVAVANQAWVDSNLEGRPALGTPVAMGYGLGDAIEVVGVAGNVQQAAGWGPTSQPVWETPTLYLAAAQATGGWFRGIHVWFSPSWIVRGTGLQQDLAVQVSRAIRDADPELPLARVATLETVMSQAFARSRFEAAFLLVVAGFALVLAGIGLYGLVAHEVLERRTEMGLRMALGATPGAAVWTTGLSGVRLTFAGLVIGAGLAVLVSRVLTHLIWGVTAFDPPTLLALLAVLGIFTSVASFVPAARAGRMDPAQILREG